MDASGFLSLFNSVLHFSDFINILFLYCDCDGRKETGACLGLCCLKEKEVFCFVTFCGWWWYGCPCQTEYKKFTILIYEEQNFYGHGLVIIVIKWLEIIKSWVIIFFKKINIDTLKPV